MNLKFILTIVGCLFFTGLFAQKMTFSGIATQQSGGISNYYPMVLELNKKGDKITGTSFFITPDGTAFVSYKLKGVQAANTLQLNEYKIVKGTQISGSWILKDMTLQLVDAVDGKRLEGQWKDSKGSSLSGTFQGKQVKMIGE